VLGLQGVPQAGDEFFVVKDEKKAKTLTELKQSESRKRKMAAKQRVTLEDLHDRISEGEMKELKIILKADVQGSIGALKESLLKLSTAEVKVNIIHEAVGNINESDVMLAMVSDAIILGFHVKTAGKADELAKKENIDIHHYDVIYKAIDEVKAGMEGLLEPEEKEVYQGTAEVRQVFSSSSGNVAGCAVTKWIIHRNYNIRVKSGGEIIHEGRMNTLKRFKNDAKEVKEGFECGVTVTGFDSYRRNDLIEAYQIIKVARRLEG
jgi:translation initiation factor IF-2